MLLLTLANFSFRNLLHLTIFSEQRESNLCCLILPARGNLQHRLWHMDIFYLLVTACDVVSFVFVMYKVYLCHVDVIFHSTTEFMFCIIICGEDEQRTEDEKKKGWIEFIKRHVGNASKTGHWYMLN